MNTPSDDPAGIGHNQGPPLNLSGSWTGYCWVRARREVWDNPPIEVVRRRLRRANELGLSYRQYTGILLDKGVRTEALVFDLSSLGRPAPQPMTFSAPRAAFAPTPAPSVDEVIERMAGKIKALRHCKILAAAEEAGALLDELNRRAGNVIADCAYYPNHVRTPGMIPAIETVLQPVLDLLARHVVAPPAAVMIGDGWRARRIAETARLALVFPHAAYFG
jgi:hypothetical protein